MYSFFSKFLMIALLFPLLVIFLTKECTHQKLKANKQTNEANYKTDGAQIGLWGGDNIQLEVTEQGAQVEYACDYGSIDQKIVPDGNGYFNVKGTHIREHGGPVREDETSNNHPAQFSGQINNKTMNLTVTESDTKKLVGKFTLVYGQETRLVKCN